ncbi:DMT family transporter [Camelimonas abortus]|uniref:DMT family transporter n=1 Tax=Camelimonas abortus TaxID=1017184 RepID=A0ABV7LJ26_9HYPH
MNALRRAGAAFYANGPALLVATTLLWAGNAVASRLAPGHISPLLLTCLRWTMVLAIVGVMFRHAIAAEWRQLARAWRRVLFLGAIGYTLFNALFYAAGAYTSALNLTLFQSCLPALILAGGALSGQARVTPLQILGMLLTMAGVAVASSHGDLSSLRNLDLNRGDVLIMIACVLYAVYTIGLGRRPQVSGATLFAGMALAALLTSIPLAAGEIVAGRAIWPTDVTGAGVLLYVAVFPSLMSQMFYMRAVEIGGPDRAAMFLNLTPVFGAFMGVAMLGERFGLYEAAALALVLGGIFIAERPGRRGRAV